MEKERGQKTQEWNDIFLEWRKSGESRRGYCQRKGISISAFGYWYKKLEKDDVEQSLVKVKGFPGIGRNGLAARAGSVVVELSGGESEELLIKIFRALEAVS
jgi:hypothetical protein